MENADICIIFALAIKENRSQRVNAQDHLTIHRGVEQLAARRAHNPEVGGSSPPPATIEDKSLDLPSFFMVAGGGLMSSFISTIPPNLPLSSLAPFRCYGSAKQTSLFCSRLNRNADKEGLWQDLVLHCVAI